MTNKEHFVTFYSPGTFFPEETTKPIDSWDAKAALRLAEGINERYGAKPFGFRFKTMVVSNPIKDDFGGELKVEPRQLESSGLFWMTGTVIKWDEIREDPEEHILASNMESKGEPLVVQNTNSYTHTSFFGAGDCILDREGNVVTKGSDPELVAYRKQVKERWA